MRPLMAWVSMRRRGKQRSRTLQDAAGLLAVRALDLLGIAMDRAVLQMPLFLKPVTKDSASEAAKGSLRHFPLTMCLRSWHSPEVSSKLQNALATSTFFRPDLPAKAGVRVAAPCQQVALGLPQDSSVRIVVVADMLVTHQAPSLLCFCFIVAGAP